MPGRVSGGSAARGQVLARCVSLALHPFAVCPAAMLLLLWLDTGDAVAALRWAALCAALVIVPVFFRLVQGVRRHRYADADVSIPGERIGLLLFGIGCMAVCYGVLVWRRAPPVLLAGFRAAVLAAAAGAVLTVSWSKVSVHAAAMAGVAAASAFYSVPLALVLGAAAVLVSWARIRLGRHTLAQVVAGWVIAVVCVAACMAASR